MYMLMEMLNLSETINKEDANFLLNLNDEDFEALVWLEETKHNKGEPYKPKAVYIKQAKSYLKQHLEQEGEYIDIKYNFSKKMKDNGRLFTSNFSLQTCKKNLRGFLAHESEYDYDMVNCHPSILKFVLTTFYDCNVESQFPTFFNFLSNRENFLEISGLQKNDVLTMMNSCKIYGNANIHAQNIDLEFKLIQCMIYNNVPDELDNYNKYKYLDTDKNKFGKFLNKLLCIFENAIINLVVKYYADEYEVTPVSSIIFDGLHISKKLDDQTEILNEITKMYGVKWSIKEFDTSIKDHELYINRSANPPPYKGDGYNDVKRDFEKSHFMTTQPICFFAEGEKGYSSYGVGEFQLLIAPFQYMSYSRGFPEQQGIFSKWTKDLDRRVYRNIDFIPSLSACPAETYNTFQGFTYDDYKHKDFEYKATAVEMFIKQIGIVVNHEPHVVDYFIKYFSHMFQQPMDLPGVCLVLKSLEGWGKDAICDVLEKLIGRDHTFRTVHMDLVFGTFNASIKDKMLIQLNEMGGKDGFGNKDKLKGLITAERITINDKMMKPYSQANYARYIISTNNLSPIEVKADSRRFVIVAADPIKPKKPWWKIWWEMVADEDSLCSIFQFLMEVDLTDFDVRNIPSTRIAKCMKQSNTPPIYTFLKHYFGTDLYKEIFLDEYVTYKNKLAFNITNFKEVYYNFCREEDLAYLNIPIKVVYALLNEINIERKQISIDGVTRKSLLIDVDALRIALVNLVVEEVEEEE